MESPRCRCSPRQRHIQTLGRQIARERPLDGDSSGKVALDHRHIEVAARAATALSRETVIARLTAGALAIVALLVAAGGYLWYQEHESKLADLARIADAQRKAEQARVTEEAGQHEAKLQAELQAAKDALQQAEASRRKSEQERVAAEHAQREARLQGELKAAKEALLRAEQAEKKADLESKSAIAALRSAEKAARPSAALDAKAAGATPKSSAGRAVAAAVDDTAGYAFAAGTCGTSSRLTTARDRLVESGSGCRRRRIRPL